MEQKDSCHYYCISLARVMLRRGEISPAKEVLKEIISRNPSCGPGWELTAEFGMQQGGLH